VKCSHFTKPEFAGISHFTKPEFAGIIFECIEYGNPWSLSFWAKAFIDNSTHKTQHRQDRSMLSESAPRWIQQFRSGSTLTSCRSTLSPDVHVATHMPKRSWAICSFAYAQTNSAFDSARVWRVKHLFWLGSDENKHIGLLQITLSDLIWKWFPKAEEQFRKLIFLLKIRLFLCCPKMQKPGCQWHFLFRGAFLSLWPSFSHLTWCLTTKICFTSGPQTKLTNRLVSVQVLYSD
jgi:hypothetical protein